MQNEIHIYVSYDVDEYRDVVVNISPSGNFSKGVFRNTVTFDKERRDIYKGDWQFAANQAAMFDELTVEPPVEIIIAFNKVLYKAESLAVGFTVEKQDEKHIWNGPNGITSNSAFTTENDAWIDAYTEVIELGLTKFKTQKTSSTS